MATYSIEVDLSPVLSSLQSAIDGTVLPRLSQAVRVVGGEVLEKWTEAVMRAKLWQGEKEVYIKSIQVRQVSDFEVEVFSNYRHAEAIESGRPAYDLKRMLDSSLKVRLSKKGKRFLIIPFRHNTPGNTAHAKDMPAEVYEQARNLKASRITGTGYRPSGTGAFDPRTKQVYLVPRRSYAWGDRLPEGTVPKLKETHKTDPYAGMVRMNTSSGGRKSSAYLTFRTMAEGAPGWVIPPRPGQNIVKGVVDDIRPKAEKIFEEAIRRDMDVTV